MSSGKKAAKITFPIWGPSRLAEILKDMVTEPDTMVTISHGMHRTTIEEILHARTIAQLTAEANPSLPNIPTPPKSGPANPGSDPTGTLKS